MVLPLATKLLQNYLTVSPLASSPPHNLPEPGLPHDTCPLILLAKHLLPWWSQGHVESWILFVVVSSFVVWAIIMASETTQSWPSPWPWTNCLFPVSLFCLTSPPRCCLMKGCHLAYYSSHALLKSPSIVVFYVSWLQDTTALCTLLKCMWTEFPSAHLQLQTERYHLTLCQASGLLFIVSLSTYLASIYLLSTTVFQK